MTDFFLVGKGVFFMGGRVFHGERVLFHMEGIFPLGGGVFSWEGVLLPFSCRFRGKEANY